MKRIMEKIAEKWKAVYLKIVGLSGKSNNQFDMNHHLQTAKMCVSPKLVKIV